MSFSRKSSTLRLTAVVTLAALISPSAMALGQALGEALERPIRQSIEQRADRKRHSALADSLDRRWRQLMAVSGRAQRDEARSVWWTAEAREVLFEARSARKLESAIERGDFFAAVNVAAVMNEAPPSGPHGGQPEDGVDFEEPFPYTPISGENSDSGFRIPSASHPGGGGASSGNGNPASLASETNTLNGNKLSVLGLYGWQSRGDLSVGMSLVHNSREELDFGLGGGWRHSFQASLLVTPSHVSVEMPDGLVVPYTLTNGVYVPPKGWNETLIKNSDNSWTLRFKNQSEWRFSIQSEIVDSNPQQWFESYLVAIRDRHGNQITIEREGEKVLNVRCPADRVVNFAYYPDEATETDEQPDGYLKSIRVGKANGTVVSYLRTWDLSYEDDFHASNAWDLRRITYPIDNAFSDQGRVFEYNSSHDMTMEYDLIGSTWRTEYDSEGRQVAAIRPARSIGEPIEARTTTFDYSNNTTTIRLPDLDSGPGSLRPTITHVYANGVLTLERDADGDLAKFTYDPHSLNVIKVETPDPSAVPVAGAPIPLVETTYGYDARGNLISTTDALGRTFTQNYNAKNDLTRQYSPIAQRITDYYYDLSGRLVRVEDAENRNVARFTHNAYGEPVTIRDGLNRTTTLGYNASGDVVSITDPAGLITTITHDEMGRPESVTDPAGLVTSYTRDEFGRVIEVRTNDDLVAVNLYDAEDNLRISFDASGLPWTRVYTADHRVSSLVAPTYTENYAYDSNGRLIAVQNGNGRNRTYEYNLRAELTRMTFADGKSEQWSYLPNGQLRSYTSPIGYVNVYEYDKVGQLKKVDYPVGTPDVTFNYDLAGRRTQMVDGTGTTTWEYDLSDKLTKLTQPQGQITYQYSAAGEQTHMKVGTESPTIRTFDPTTGRLTKITNPLAEETSIAYDSAGRVLRKTVSSGTHEEYGYDSRSRLTSVAVKTSANAALRSQSYTYDAVGRVETHTVDGRTTTYGYDDIGLLTSESRPAQGSSPAYSASYTYDGNGNRLTKTLNGVTEYYVYDHADKLLSVRSGSFTGTILKQYGYDDAGRTTSVVSSAGTTAITYDHESRITSIAGPGTSASYTYNGLDTRVSKIENSTSRSFLRDGAYVTDSVLKEFDGASLVADHTPGISERRGSTSTFHHGGMKSHDAQSVGSALASTRQYDAFGQVLSSTGTWSGPFGHAGGFGYQEDNTGLQLLGHRYYDPSTGRFLTRDPIKDGRNWYAYGAGDSAMVAASDPTGLFRIGAGGVIGAGAGIGGELSGGISIGTGGPGLELGAGGGIEAGAKIGGGAYFEVQWGDVRPGPSTERVFGLDTPLGLDLQVDERGNLVGVGTSIGPVVGASAYHYRKGKYLVTAEVVLGAVESAIDSANALMDYLGYRWREMLKRLPWVEGPAPRPVWEVGR